MLRQGKVERALDTKEKSLPEYLAYIRGVHNYLISFFDRALPLIDVQKRLTQAEDDFATAWEAGRVEGWEAETSSKPKQVEGGIWCPYCQCPLRSRRKLTFVRSKTLLQTDGVRRAPHLREAQEAGEGGKDGA